MRRSIHSTSKTGKSQLLYNVTFKPILGSHGLGNFFETGEVRFHTLHIHIYAQHTVLKKVNLLSVNIIPMSK